MSDWVETLQADIGCQGLPSSKVLWRHQMGAWPDDVINFKMRMSISQEPSVRMRWNFADRYRWWDLSPDRFLWSHQKWTWPYDVIYLKMRMSVSHESNVRLSWNFADRYRVTRSIAAQSFVTCWRKPFAKSFARRTVMPQVTSSVWCELFDLFLILKQQK